MPGFSPVAGAPVADAAGSNLLLMVISASATVSMSNVRVGMKSMVAGVTAAMAVLGRIWQLPYTAAAIATSALQQRLAYLVSSIGVNTSVSFLRWLTLARTFSVSAGMALLRAQLRIISADAVVSSVLIGRSAVWYISAGVTTSVSMIRLTTKKFTHALVSTAIGMFDAPFIMIIAAVLSISTITQRSITMARSVMLSFATSMTRFWQLPFSAGVAVTAGRQTFLHLVRVTADLLIVTAVVVSQRFLFYYGTATATVSAVADRFRVLAKAIEVGVSIAIGYIASRRLLHTYSAALTSSTAVVRTFHRAISAAASSAVAIGFDHVRVISASISAAAVVLRILPMNIMASALSFFARYTLMREHLIITSRADTDRTMIVPAENRTMTVPAEPRVMIVPPDDRAMTL